MEEIKDKKAPKKRTYVRLGDVYCVECDKYKRYFQYFAKDETNMKSPVIRVFEKKYGLEENPNVEEIVKDDVDFYAHTYFISVGVENNYWYKYSKSKNLGSQEDIVFKMYFYPSPKYATISHEWYIWKLNQKRIFIGDLPRKYRKCTVGYIYSALTIYGKIKTGKWPIKGCDVI